MGELSRLRGCMCWAQLGSLHLGLVGWYWEPMVQSQSPSVREQKGIQQASSLRAVTTEGAGHRERLSRRAKATSSGSL